MDSSALVSTRSGTDDRFAKEVDAADDEPEHAGRGERILRDLLHIERRLLRRCVPAAPLMEDDSAGPREGTLVRRADIERELGRHAEVLTLPSGTYPLVGLEMFKECSARYAELASEMFALSGELKDYKAIPQLAANLLKAERGRGAASFYILRNIRGTTRDGKSKSTAFYATVFAPKGVHGKQLIRCQKEKLPVTVLARIVVAEPDGEWKGFTIIEKKQRHWSWAFVVDDVVASTPSTNSD